MVENKTYKINIVLRVSMPLVVAMMFYTLIFDKVSISFWDLIPICAFSFLTIFGFEYKIYVDNGGIEIKSKILPHLNEKISWKDVKRVKYGLLFKEVEFFSRKRNKTTVKQLTGIGGNLDKIIMKEINQEQKRGSA